MGFHDLIATLREPGEGGVPDTIYDDLSGQYDLAVAGGAEQVSTLQLALSERDAEIAALKAMNFDLLVAQGSSSPSEGSEPEPPEADDDSAGVDDLFEEDED